MKGELMQKILETFEDIALFPFESAEAILRGGYSVSFSRLEYESDKIRNRRLSRRLEREEIKDRKRKLQKYISKLKIDGLVTENTDNSNKLILSEKGERRLMELRQRQGYKNYKKEASPNLVIITFDIPEEERAKRDWLRDILRKLDFEMIQKSVWIGKIKIPKEFLADLERVEILDYLEIFEVTKTGTLRKVKD